MTALSCIALRAGPLTVGIDPENGGSLTRFDVRTATGRTEIFRSAIRGPVRIARSLNASSFPLLPYGGRLRDGQLSFEGRRICFPLNAKPERHSSHGDGFTRSWSIRSLERTRAVLEIDPLKGAPINYDARQTLELHPDRLEIRLRIENLEDARMPVGVGLHPYFARRETARVTARLPVEWLWDTEMMPLKSVPNTLEKALASGLAAKDLPVMAQYCGWDGRATIDWPEQRLRCEITTFPALEHVVTWAPKDESFFCFEPLSHATDSFNLWQTVSSAELKPASLEPGESMEQLWTFAIASET